MKERSFVDGLMTGFVVCLFALAIFLIIFDKIECWTKCYSSSGSKYFTFGISIGN